MFYVSKVNNAPLVLGNIYEGSASVNLHGVNRVKIDFTHYYASSLEVLGFKHYYKLL